MSRSRLTTAGVAVVLTLGTGVAMATDRSVLQEITVAISAAPRTLTVSGDVVLTAELDVEIDLGAIDLEEITEGDPTPSALFTISYSNPLGNEAAKVLVDVTALVDAGTTDPADLPAGLSLNLAAEPSGGTEPPNGQGLAPETPPSWTGSNSDVVGRTAQVLITQIPASFAGGVFDVGSTISIAGTPTESADVVASLRYVIADD
jgi:hypothetical protein